jgi:ABC-2 type transport system ATP-binding protein
MTLPEVLFLDEPTQGLDPQNRANIWAYIQTLRRELGLTILLTTHYMEEAEFLADRVGIVDHGKLIVEGVPADLARSLGADVVTLTVAGPVAAFQSSTAALPYISHTTHQPEPQPGDSDPAPVTIQLGVDNGDRRLAEIVALAASSALTIHTISVSKPTLSDVFFAHTGRALRDE